MEYTNTEKISNILNKTKAYIEIGRALKIEIDPDSQIFHEIEEYIYEKYEEMEEEKYEL
tara:strand:+ start:1461 stop:1637 length:177 start_codon:yes stop_codon:yes gene_type:complete